MFTVRPDDRYEIRLSGTGGQGIITAGMILGEAAALSAGLNACMTQSYGPEARGGACRAELVVSPDEIDAPKVGSADLLLAMSQEAYDKYAKDVKEWGIIVVDSSLVKFQHTENTFPLPFTSIAREKVGFAVTANIVAVGFIAGLTGLTDRETMKATVAKKIPPGTEATNFKALDIGFDAAKEPLSNFGLPIGPYVTTNFVKVSPTTSIRQAVIAVLESDLKAAMVTDNGDLQGIFTLYDGVRAIGAGRNPSKTMVKEFMSRKVMTCTKACTIGEVLNRMEGQNYKTIPVLDEKGDLEGVVSYYGIQEGYEPDGVIDEAVEFIDATRTLLTGGRWSMLKSISRNPVKAGADMPVSEVAARMSSRRADNAIVVDAEDHPIGIFTEADMAKRIISRGANISTPVEKVMTKRLVMVDTSETVVCAFEKMHRSNIHHLPLTNKAGKLVGSVAYTDIARIVNSRLYLGETMMSDQIPSSDE